MKDMHINIPQCIVKVSSKNHQESITNQQPLQPIIQISNHRDTHTHTLTRCQMLTVNFGIQKSSSHTPMDNSCPAAHHQSHSPHGVEDMPNTRYACSKEDVPWTMGYPPRSRHKWDSPWLMSQIRGEEWLGFLEGWCWYVYTCIIPTGIFKHGYILYSGG